MFYMNHLELITKQCSQIWEYSEEEMKLKKKNLFKMSFILNIISNL